MKYFLLVASAAEDFDGRIVKSSVIAQRRLDARKWGLYRNTPHKREITAGDTLIIYLAGQKVFYASAVADKIIFDGKNYSADGDVLTNSPVAILQLTNVRNFLQPILIEDLKSKLKFIPQSPKWGCVLQRGVKRISPSDASLILSSEDQLDRNR